MRIVITGGSGLLALNMAMTYREQHPVCLITHTRPVQLKGVESRSLDLDKVDPVAQLLKDWKADLVIHTAGMTNVDQCEARPEDAIYVNAELAGNVAQASLQANARCIHISTDHLFQGDREFLDEQAVPSPINSYGRSKWEGEKRVLKTNPGALVVRTNFFGWGTPVKQSLSDWIINSLRAGETIRAFSDIFFSPLLIAQLGEGIVKLAEMGKNGIYNVVGSERLSKYEFALKIARAFDLDEALIQNSSIADSHVAVTRPRDMSLSNARVTADLGRGFGNLDEALLQLRQQEEAGYRKELEQCFFNAQ